MISVRSRRRAPRRRWVDPRRARARSDARLLSFQSANGLPRAGPSLHLWRQGPGCKAGLPHASVARTLMHLARLRKDMVSFAFCRGFAEESIGTLHSQFCSRQAKKCGTTRRGASNPRRTACFAAPSSPRPPGKRRQTCPPQFSISTACAMAPAMPTSGSCLWPLCHPFCAMVATVPFCAMMMALWLPSLPRQ